MPLKHSQRGSLYMMILVYIAFIGVSMAAAGMFWSRLQQREREAELLFAGDQFRSAIKAYYNANPGISMYPRKLEDLVSDPRFYIPKHHLRKIYTDPMTGKNDWGLVKNADGSIIGVYSTSNKEPYKRAGFSRDDEAFASAHSYSGWQFIFTPPTTRF